eukprot:CAMPEP_0205806050 /NCGR_PEP_ID=MMETSP0205-20121125/9447_1 /ASSEMBLY_ACC=CAM_ASM_000278 /TAXON_ID=36767 /ORGANISM="Euplotes focardii, Strain TN1" /LENGTH=130 /DNA_ID=CAMNT_0053078227 /DNA_START=388 /DNA_END=780 /DNA_ORIENTATION=+
MDYFKQSKGKEKEDKERGVVDQKYGIDFSQEVDGINAIIDVQRGMSKIKLNDKENSSGLGNEVIDNPFKLKKTPYMFDSQKKFKGDSYSEMKNKRIINSSQIHHNFVDNLQWNIEYADSIISKMFNDEEK